MGQSRAAAPRGTPAASAGPARPQAAALSRPRPSGSSSCSWKGRCRRWTPGSTSRSCKPDDGKVGPGGGTLTASKFKFAQHGQTGTWVSELYPHIAKHVDKLCFIRGLHTDTPAHPQAVIQLHTGTALASLTRPSMGAWLLYGLGTENQDLPGYITINPPPNFGGAVNYGSAFLPAHFQGTRSTTPATCRTCKPQAADAAAAQAARPDPGDEPRPGRDARRARRSSTA